MEFAVTSVAVSDAKQVEVAVIVEVADALHSAFRTPGEHFGVPDRVAPNLDYGDRAVDPGEEDLFGSVSEEVSGDGRG